MHKNPTEKDIFNIIYECTPVHNINTSGDLISIKDITIEMSEEFDDNSDNLQLATSEVNHIIKQDQNSPIVLEVIYIPITLTTERFKHHNCVILKYKNEIDVLVVYLASGFQTLF